MTETDPNTLAKFQDLDSLWNPQDPAGSEARLRSLLDDAQALTGRDQGYRIELHAFIGRAGAQQGRFAEARASLKCAEELLGPEATYRVSAKIRWLLEAGRLEIAMKTPSQARALFSEAWTLAINSGEDSFAVEIAQLMATIEPQKAQREWIVRAIEIAESSPSQKTKRWLGSLYTALGWRAYDLRQFEKALEIFQKALRHLNVNGTDREIFVARWSTGKILRTLGKTEEALAIQNALLAELGIGGARDGRLYEEIAECLHALKRAPEAQLYFDLAYRELSGDEWVTDNQPLRLKRMKDLGKVKGTPG